MEMDVSTLAGLIFGTFLFGVSIGEIIERVRNKKAIENTYYPLINDYRSQKSDMWKKIRGLI